MGLFLVRHCSAMGQEPEAPLTVEGVDQAKKLADFLCNHGVSRIISSPYCRAIDSARPLATVLKISIETDVRLVERNLGLVSDGDWRAALRESFEKPKLCLPNGESSIEAMARGRAVIDELSDDQGNTAAVFTHGNLLTLLVRSFDQQIGFEFWEALNNPDVVQLYRKASSVALRKIWT